MKTPRIWRGWQGRGTWYVLSWFAKGATVSTSEVTSIVGTDMRGARRRGDKHRQDRVRNGEHGLDAHEPPPPRFCPSNHRLCAHPLSAPSPAAVAHDGPRRSLYRGRRIYRSVRSISAHYTPRYQRVARPRGARTGGGTEAMLCADRRGRVWTTWGCVPHSHAVGVEVGRGGEQGKRVVHEKGGGKLRRGWK
ncbi:hypothetical protein M427DRAFT_276991 [Gonapodya prolifera JEL478]|uniref:Uncharacterized protein n=1 Tax=Gonapodya prolifera (strain JEL478) TaxID=1344416 RepID=A0A139AYB1_GONPJ|nr:hypothetical protein M427DRAFT_276991 [Gonapodya prolifera JEL478]|eukprot:KXS21709.1 hypothetical protein M427DRAFT_276991 [Gonapodya prolifera JEL478]